MGISKRGRFAVLTNYRTPASKIDLTARSRGAVCIGDQEIIDLVTLVVVIGRLVSDYLCGDASPLDYCTKVIGDGCSYNGFALITADLQWVLVCCALINYCNFSPLFISAGGSLAYCSNREEGGLRTVEPGTHGLSNHILNSPWRKVQRGKSRLAEIVADLNKNPTSQETLTEQLLDLLSDDTRYAKQRT